MKMRKLILASVVALAASPVWAIFTNGGFETGNFNGWTTASGINNGLTLPQPFTGNSLNIGAGGTFRSNVISSGPDLQGAPITLPYAGAFTARVNNDATGGITNQISQSDVVSAADRDPSDGKLHVRFAYAANIENPNHSPEQQPFIYVRLRDVTAGTVLFEDFTFGGQSGKPFHTYTVPSGRSFQYLDWTPVNIIVPDANIGHTLEIFAVGSDCSPTAHSAYTYLDGFGSIVVPPGTGTTSAVTAIPTLSEWGLILLSISLGGAALWQRRRSR